MTWRYVRIWEQYMYSYYRQLQCDIDIVANNIIGTFLDQYVADQLPQFVNSPDPYKSWRQYVYAVRPFLIMVVDQFWTDYLFKLNKIRRELGSLLREHRREFIERFRTVYHREPTMTHLRLYDSFIELFIGELNVETISDAFGISVSTVRTYLRQLRTIINSLITDYREHYMHLSRIQLRFLLVPVGALGRRFYEQVNHCRCYTVWHLISCMLPEKDRQCVAQLFWYIVFTYLYIHGCNMEPFNETPMCREVLRDNYDVTFGGKTAIMRYHEAFVAVFQDYESYFTIVDPRNYRQRRRFVAMWERALREHDNAVTLLVTDPRYNIRPTHRSLETFWLR